MADALGSEHAELAVVVRFPLMGMRGLHPHEGEETEDRDRDEQPSHSLMIQDSLHPIMISISVWPECDLDSLPARFRSEIGVNYFKAADSYRNKSFSMGAKGFTHLFFCFNRTNCGVAVAFFPCDQSYDDQGMIIPESIYRDEMPRQR